MVEFKYDYYSDFLRKMINNSKFVSQVEIHPGINCGGFDCKFCYGQNFSTNRMVPLDKKIYLKAIKDISPYVHLIAFAGIRSDPLSYPHFNDLISNVIERKIQFGIHTKGHLFTDEIIKTLAKERTNESFVTISFDTVSKGAYNVLHGLPEGSTVFNLVYSKIRKLYKLKGKKKSLLMTGLL